MNRISDTMPQHGAIYVKWAAWFYVIQGIRSYEKKLSPWTTDKDHRGHDFNDTLTQGPHYMPQERWDFGDGFYRT